MNELKPCPFCGNTELELYRPDGYYTIVCDVCNVSTDYYAYGEEAAAVWNRRDGYPPSPPPSTSGTKETK